MIYGTQDKPFFPQDSMLAKMRAIQDFGFDCYEIDGGLLLEKEEEAKEAIQETGLPISSACGGYHGWIGDFDEGKRHQALEEISRMLEALHEVGGKGIVVPAAWGMFSLRLPPMVPPRDHAGDLEALMDSLNALEPVAAEYDQYLYLEPLNRYEDHMLNTLSSAAELIDLGHFSRVKLTADFYHMSIEEDDLSQSLIRFKDYIGHVHVAENHRYQPGTGSMDFRKHIGTLRSIGYNGEVIFEGRVRGNDQAKAYRQSVVYMRQFIPAEEA